MRMERWVGGALIAALAGCGSSGGSNGPTPTIAIAVTATPSPINGTLCAGCGAGSTDREATTTLAIRETAGAAGTVTQIEMTLRENGTNAVIASGSFESGGIAQLAGSNRLQPRGTLNVPCGVHYAAGQGGKSAVLTYIVHVTDDRGTQITQTLAVNAAT